MPCLIHPTGALDQAAIDAEIETQLAIMSALWADWTPAQSRRQYALYREVIANHVNAEAIGQQWPHVQAAIRYSADERAELARIHAAMDATPQHERAAFDALVRQQQFIASAAQARAFAEIESRAPVMQAAE